jgi:hypothetical protein
MADRCLRAFDMAQSLRTEIFISRLLTSLKFTYRASNAMPEKRTVEKAKKAKRQGKSSSTQAGEFVREEIRHVRQGKHGVRSTKQAIAIGLSKARRAGVDLPPPKKGTVSERTRRSAASAYKKGRRGNASPSRRRSAATQRALKREGRSAASKKALSKQARSAARKRPRTERSAAARRGARTKGRAGRSAAARKAGRTRARRV